MRIFFLIVLLLPVRLLAADQKVGVILPLTGDFAYFGEEFRKGFEIASQNSALSGVKLPKIIFEDDQCLAKTAVSAYKRLFEVEKVSLLIGPACSTAINAVSPIAKKHNVPNIFVLDTGDKVAALPDPLYSFGFDPPKMAKLLAEHAYKNNIHNIGIITEDEEYSNLISDAFLKSFIKSGGKTVISEIIPVNSSDVRSVLTKVISKKPDAIFYSSAYQAGSFLKQLRLLNPSIPVYGNDTMCVADTIAAAGDAANGARCGNVVLDEKNAAVLAFREELAKKYGSAPSSLFYAALGHDSFNLMLKELRIEHSASMLLGVGQRRADGMYDIEPSVLKIEAGKIILVE